MSGPIWITERDVEQLSISQAIEALRSGLLLEASSGAANLEKTHLRVDGGANIHAIGAAFPGDGLCGVKSWVHTPAGANPVEVLWDAKDGRLLAIIEAFALGQLRTAAIAGLATDHLADAAADELALCGTGRQSLAQVAAVAAVRRIERVRVYGRDPDRRNALLGRIEAELGLRADGFDAVAPAVADAPIVTLVTRASEPFLLADMVATGAHVNAMGAITPERCEFEAQLLARCVPIVVDSIAQARELASELRTFFADSIGWTAVSPLCELVASGAERPQGADVTLFKSLGMGIADLSVAREVYRRARESGTAVALPTPQPAPLRFVRPGG